jgi:hypothetical protein
VGKTDRWRGEIQSSVYHERLVGMLGGLAHKRPIAANPRLEGHAMEAGTAAGIRANDRY